MNQQAIQAEQMGKAAYVAGVATHKDAEKQARRLFSAVFLQDCFVAGWNTANWDAIGDQLKKGE